MRRDSPFRLIGVGAILVVIGAVLPMLMVLRIVESQMWLNFISFGSSIAGLVVGMYGLFEYQRGRETDKDNRF